MFSRTIPYNRYTYIAALCYKSLEFHPYRNVKYIFPTVKSIKNRLDELNPGFGFDRGKKDSYHVKYGPRFAIILAHLWDIYIDGRLDKLGFYEIDPNEKIGIKGHFFKRDKRRMRLASINTLQSGGVHDAEQVHDKVWHAKEGEYAYDQLAQLALDHMCCLRT